MDVLDALRAHGEVGAQIVDLLYGDAATEVSKALVDVSKRAPLTSQQRSERTQNRVAGASNVLGIGAGVAGLHEAGQKFNSMRRGLKPVERVVKRPKLALAGGALALQGANLVGDGVTNRVIARAKKREAVGKGVDDITWTGEIAKMDTDKRQVFGWASVTHINGAKVTDLQDDEIDLEEIEKAAYSYVGKSRVGGNMHQKDGEGPKHVSDLIESLVLTPEKAAALGLTDVSKASNGWWVGFQVNDDETWDGAKKGELTMFSIHGTGRRVG